MTNSPRASAAPETRGVHHLALCTDDIKATIDFYVDVMGMPLVHAMKVPPGVGVGPGNRGNPPYESIRHYFFNMGNDSLLAFFEIPKGREQPHNRNAIGAMQHCAFVVTPDLFKALEARLKKYGVPYIGPIPQMPGLDGIFLRPQRHSLGVRLPAGRWKCAQHHWRSTPGTGGGFSRTRHDP